MKRIIIIILLLIVAYSLSAEMEFEKVYQVFPEGGIARQTELYFKHDTILLKTKSTHNRVDALNYFYSTDVGKNWTNLRNNFRIDEPINDKYDYLGELHPLTFEFVKPYRFNDTTTFIYYMNLQGEILKKVSYPFLPDYLYVRLNPIDPDFISIHSPKERMFPLEYNHEVGYSADRGDTWDYIRPEVELKEQRDISLNSLRKIEYYFSPITKGKMLFNFDWDNGFGSWYRLTTGFNYFDKEYDFSSRSYNLDKLLCYECFELDKLTFINPEEKEFDSFDLFSGEKATMIFKDRLPMLNSDSLSSEDKVVDLYGFWSDGTGFLKSNLKNNNHKVLYITIRSEYLPAYRIDYINQLFFQTFDNGETWEFIFNNDDLYHQVVGMFINHTNNDLWILKDSTVSNMMAPQSWYQVLYKSKTPLTSVEYQSNSKFSVNFQNNNLNIISDKYFNNSTISFYNLSGKSLLNKSIDLQMGDNTITIDQPITDKLILVQITTNETQIFKLLRSD